MIRRRPIQLLLLLLALASPRSVSTAIAPPSEAVPEGRFLTGKLLVAEPHLPDPNFRRTVVFMVRHDEKGAFGLVVNRLIASQKLSVLLESMGGKGEGVEGEIRVHYGGPVERQRGFLLHSLEGERTPTIPVDEIYGVTANVEILEDVARGKGPKRALLTLGYAGWGTGQLEREIRRGDWVIAPASDGILFDTDYETKWKRALASRFVQT
jgi:putative transcriptional regulator